MPFFKTDDGFKLFYAEVGSGPPIVFLHEFASDYSLWATQVASFTDRYRCITYNARGYPPSDVPEDVTDYSLERAVADLRSLLEHLGIERAHIVGLSMGAFTTLQFGMELPERAHTLTIAGCGYGSHPGEHETFRQECEKEALLIDGVASEERKTLTSLSPSYLELKERDPHAWALYKETVSRLSPIGLSNTLRGVHKNRRSLWEHEKRLRSLNIPTLILAGDEDLPCLEPSLFLRRTIPSSALLVVPNTGHIINQEQPDLFNDAIGKFFRDVESGSWKLGKTARSDKAALFTFGASSSHVGGS